MINPSSHHQPAHRARRGFNLADLCVSLATAGLMITLVLPTLAVSSREEASRIKCANNLRQIAGGVLIYASENVGRYPRTYWNPRTADSPALYTGARVTNAFQDASSPASALKANDVTASFYLLLKTTDLAPEQFICPSSDATPLAGNIRTKANFTGPQELSYSYSNPFPTIKAVEDGWHLDVTQAPDHALAADMNVGDNDKGGPTKVAYNAVKPQMETANSPNHWFEGQQVAYPDQRVEWHTNPFAGPKLPNRPWRDNIYANANGVDGQGMGGVVRSAPYEKYDMVLLPTAKDVAPGAAAPATARVPGEGPPAGIMAWLMIGVAVVVVIAVAFLTVWFLLRRKPRAA